MLERLRINDEDFKRRFIDITSVYCAPFDSDTVLAYLKEGTLKDGVQDYWIAEIPPFQFNIEKDEWKIPTTIVLNTPDGEEEVEMPETIEEFRAMAKAYGLKVSLNTQTAVMLYG